MAKKTLDGYDIRISDIRDDHRTPYAREKSILRKVDNWLEDQKKSKEEK